MRVAVAGCIVLCAALASPLVAQETPPEAAPAKPVDAEAVKKAEGVLKDSAKAYASAKAISDTITFTAKTPDGEQKQQMNVAVQGSDHARLAVDDMTFTAVGGSLYAERKGIDDKFAQFTVEGDLATALGGEIGFAPPQIVARSTDDIARLLEAWTFGMLPTPAISGHAMGKSEAGEAVHQIALSSPAGDGELHINADSLLVEKATIRMKMTGAPEMSFTLAYAPKISDSVSPAIAFEPGSRQKVSSLDELKIDLTGKAAPDFTLETLDGSKVTLSELKGNVVILDFWATWCGPCKMALPKLNDFAKWAKDSGKPVKVYAVDVWERTKPEETKKAVSEFWSKNGYVMPTLLDLNSETASKYGYDAIPTTVVVGPDGKVFAVHTGFNPEMADELKKNVEEALAAAGK